MSPPAHLLYQHTQIGYVALAGVAVAIVVYVLMRRRKSADTADSRAEGVSRNRAVKAAALAVAIVLLMFVSLTVRVDRANVSWSAGPGVIRGSVADSDIVGARRVATGSGWGLRHSEEGWLYNVSGTEAVEIQLRNGQSIRLGTDEPAQLLAAIRTAVNQ